MSLNLSSPSTTIFETNETKEVLITPRMAEQANQLYKDCCEKITQYILTNSETFGEISEDELRKLIPEAVFNIKESKKQKQTKKKLDFDSWNQSKSIEELMTLTSEQLKTILSNNSKSISGSKSILSNRVLSINFPELSQPETLTKKKGRPKKQSIKDSNVIEEELDLETMIENADTIYLKRNNDSQLSKSSKSNGAEKYILIKNKQWIFKEGDEGYEFIGVLQSKIVDEETQPEELLKMYNQ